MPKTKNILIPKNPVHPGRILFHQFLEPLNLAQKEFARQINVPLQRVNDIVNGRRGITPETAWLFADAFGMSPAFWMNLQMFYDLARKRPKKRGRRITRKAT